MKFIDLNDIGPPAKNVSHVWISYMGDSLARDLFYASIQRLSGYEYKESWLEESYKEAPLLGKT